MLLQCRDTTEDIAQETKLLEWKLLLCQLIRLCNIQTLLRLLLLQATDTKQCVDILCAHLLALHTKLRDATCQCLPQPTRKLCLTKLLRCCILRQLRCLREPGAAKTLPGPRLLLKNIPAKFPLHNSGPTSTKRARSHSPSICCLFLYLTLATNVCLRSLDNILKERIHILFVRCRRHAGTSSECLRLTESRFKSL